MRTIHDVLNRLRGEYLEMPGLSLTAAQVQRLCGIEEKVCQAVLGALVDAKFLYVNSNGSYARFGDGEIMSHPRGKADLEADIRSRRAS